MKSPENAGRGSEKKIRQVFGKRYRTIEHQPPTRGGYMADSLLQLARAIDAVNRDLQSATKAIADEVYKRLKTLAEEYKRRVVRVIPRETGDASKSFVVVMERSGDAIRAIVGNTIKSKKGAPYPSYLEFGTKYIAGGLVKEWQPGMQPMLFWPAKMRDVNPAKYKPGTKKREKAARLYEAVQQPGQGNEQMPFMRPVGLAMMPLVRGQMVAAVNEGLAKKLKKRYGETG